MRSLWSRGGWAFLPLSVAALYLMNDVFIPLVLSIFLFLFLEPTVGWFERRYGVSRRLSSPIVVLLAVALTGALGWGAYVESANVMRQIPQYSGKIRSAIHAIQGKAEIFQSGTESLMPKTPEKEDVQKVQVIEPAGSNWKEAFMSGLHSVFGILAGMFFVPVLALFFLLEKPYLRKALEHTPLGESYPLSFMGREMARMVRGFFFGNLVVGLFTSLGFLILFMKLGLESALPLALAAGFINLIPLLGAILGACFPIAQALLQFDTAGPALLILAVSVFLHFLVANLVMPQVIGSRINVNATCATAGLLFWGWIWGGVGLLLAIPLVAMLRIILTGNPTTQSWGMLLAEGPEGQVHQGWFRKPRRKIPHEVKTHSTH